MIRAFALFALLAILGCQKPPTAQPAVVPIPAAKPLSEQPKPILKSTVPYLDEVRAAAEFRFGVPAPVPVILGQIEQESAFNPLARSPVGAQGLMQFIPSTWEWAAKAGGFGIGGSPLDPKANIQAGVWFDRWLFDRVRVADSRCDRWLFSLSGFNGGEGWVWKRQAKSKSPGSWAQTGTINPGITEANQKQNATYGPRIIYALQPKYVTLGPLVCKGDT